MLDQVQTFPCPNCKEIINDSMKQCRFCSAPVDPQTAMVAGELQSRVNQACSDASFLRIAAVAMYVFIGVSFIPFFGLVYWGFVVTFFVVLFLLIRWQIRFGSLKTGDPDYVKARRSKNVALILWLLAIPVGFILRPLADVIISAILSL